MLNSDDIPTSIAAGLVLTAIVILWVVVLVRVSGLRSLAKMTGFDFVTTVAVGSLIANAGTSTSWTGFAQALAAIGGLFALQWLLARARVHSKMMQNVLGNEPVLLMEQGRFIDEALTAERVARADIYAKMRQAGVLDPESVRAVVLERTGDISIIQEGPVDDALFSDVSDEYHAKSKQQ